MSGNQEGPSVSVQRSCFDCMHCKSESYRVQGDSGHDVYCIHPKAQAPNAERRLIGDTTWRTPVWCPIVQAVPV